MSAWLLLALASWAAAKTGPAACVEKAKGALLEPASLDALVTCQKKALDAAIARHLKTHGGAPAPDELMDAWLDAQRAETSDYLQRHPSRAALSSGTAALAEAKGVSNGAPGVRQGGGDEATLKDDLWKMSNDGKNGLTPEMDQKITDYLQQKQGEVSPEMRDLLDALKKDGPNLSEETMRKLKSAARSADAAGLDLGVDQKTKDLLLDKSQDPAPPTN